MERSATQETVAVIGSLADVVFASESSADLLDTIDRPEIRIVSLTVTEHGYCLNRSTKQLDPNHTLIREDLVHPERPSSAIGIIVEAYRRRREAGRPPFTALSCDNIQHNGSVLREAVLALASLRDMKLAEWIRENASFPSTMVDRITPVTVKEDVTALAERYGVIDRWPVFSETFTQWVIEDRFPSGRPAWEDVGAQFVADVAPYEFMKLRLLNASHLAVAGLGRLIGYVTIDEAMADALIARYMTALMDRETGPTLPAVPGIDLPRYKATLVERFANPAIKDTVERVNTDAPLNVLVDPIRDRLRTGRAAGTARASLGRLAPPGAWGRRARRADRGTAPTCRTTAREGDRGRPRPAPAARHGSAFWRYRHRSAPGRASRPMADLLICQRQSRNPGLGVTPARVLSGRRRLPSLTGPLDNESVLDQAPE